VGEIAENPEAHSQQNHRDAKPPGRGARVRLRSFTAQLAEEQIKRDERDCVAVAVFGGRPGLKQKLQAGPVKDDQSDQRHRYPDRTGVILNERKTARRGSAVP
jgi:hypothetical protein